jgi:catechol 2,3-dioxygenase-like lactoylglutathione lyase family enzyme
MSGDEDHYMSVSKLLAAILSDRLADTKDFYISLLGFKVVFASDFFIELVSSTNSAVGLGIWRRDHELVPQDFQHQPQGVVLSFAVEDADVAYVKAEQLGLKIVQSLRNESYGQRHFMTVDPNGLLLDVTSPIAMSAEFMTIHGLG